MTIPRKPVPKAHDANRTPGSLASSNVMLPVTATLGLIILVYSLEWARRWLWSGCAIESIIILYGTRDTTRIFSAIPLWTLLTTLNLLYAISATSWLLWWWFLTLCYPAILLTCLFQFDFAAEFARRSLRKMLRQLHFTSDRIALFNLPALEIDTDVNGLMVIRGVTISLSSLTIVAHGIELGLKLADEIELAIHVDEVKIPLFRRIEVGHVFGNVKGGKPEMTFAELDEDSSETDDEAIFEANTALLRAATAGAESFRDRPKLRESLTGVGWMKDSSAKQGLELVKTLSPDDQEAERQYFEFLAEIRMSSAIHQSRQHVLQRSEGDDGLKIDSENDVRAAICAELQEVPSVTHPPQRSVRVTTLQRLAPPTVRRFLHRLPLLLRLLLGPLSYFHPISIQSVNTAGSGKWLTALLQQRVFRHYIAHNAELRRLAKRVSAWLADANFCLEIVNIEGQGQVPISAASNITTSLHFADIIAYRTAAQSSTIAQVVRLGGADATVVIPSYLLPHHEHILPPKPTPADKSKQAEEVDNADGRPKTLQAEHKLEEMQKDETMLRLSVHASLPACFDQSLLNFVAALVKATKIIELEKQAYVIEGSEDPGSPNYQSADDDSINSVSRTDSGFKTSAKNLFAGLRDGSGKRDAFKDFAKDVHQATTSGMKKAAVIGILNDRWIAKMVGKVATKLEQAQGDVGYSGEIPIALDPYRARAEQPTKLLP